MTAPTLTSQLWLNPADVSAIRDGVALLVADNFGMDVLLYLAGANLGPHADEPLQVMLVASEVDLIAEHPEGLVVTAEGNRKVGWHVRQVRL